MQGLHIQQVLERATAYSHCSDETAVSSLLPLRVPVVNEHLHRPTSSKMLPSVLQAFQGEITTDIHTIWAFGMNVNFKDDLHKWQVQVTNPQ